MTQKKFRKLVPSNRKDIKIQDTSYSGVGNVDEYTLLMCNLAVFQLNGHRSFGPVISLLGLFHIKKKKSHRSI